jgi:hypothetical protein
VEKGKEGYPYINELLTEVSKSKTLSESELFELLQQVNEIIKEEEFKLYNCLLNYKNSMTDKPGNCNLFSYKFIVKTDQPIVGYSRPIPFALRPVIRQRIEQIICGISPQLILGCRWYTLLTRPVQKQLALCEA